MITFILGPSGSGKTSYMIDKANKLMKAGNGNIVFIDSDDSQMFSLDHSVRLINAKQYGVKSVDRLYGFLAGIIARDYDCEMIFVDGIYDIIDLSEDLENLTNALLKLTDENHVLLVLGLNRSKDEVPTQKGVDYVELAAND